MSSTPRLHPAVLATLPGAVPRPRYDRGALTEGIVHLGVGGFHRSHLAVYVDRLLERGEGAAWAICGVGLLSGDAAMRDALVPQAGLYTLVERSAAGERASIVGAITSYLLAPDHPGAVVAKLAAPTTHIVSLTITESGYLCDEATGELDVAHPDVAADLRGGESPRSVYGYLAAALADRRRAGLRPFTVVSCDNVQKNGDLVRRMLLAFARHRDAHLAAWLAEHGAFPNSMVDRITPRTTDEDRARVASEIGVLDAAPVVTEPFLQWVIEDHFSDGRPPWESVGVQLTDDVEPYELMKLRLLNASHSAMGYLGYLAGHRYIHEVIADPLFLAYVRGMMEDEVRPLLAPVPGIELDHYIATLLERFANPTIQDQVSRICMDGSGKLPKFILPSIRERQQRGAPSRRLALCVAAWFRYLTGEDEQGAAFPIDDPMAAELQARARSGRTDPAALLAMTRIFGDDLAHAPDFGREVREALASLYARGARATLREYA